MTVIMMKMTQAEGRMSSGLLARWFMAGAMALSLTACGLTAPRSSEGYADLESLGVRDTDTVMTLSIGPALRINAMSGNLQQDGWEPVLLIRGDDEATHMLIRVVDQQICGMTVLVSDGDSEAVVINLMGEIKPQQFSDVMVALDVEAPGVENVKVAEAEET